MSKARLENDKAVEFPLRVKITGEGDVNTPNEEPVAISNRAETKNLVDWYKSLSLVWKIVLGIIVAVVVAGIVGFLIYRALQREKTMEYYVFTVKTGDVKDAGTFAKVEAMLYGDQDVSYSLALNQSTNLLSLNNFNRNGLDKFFFHEKSVGKLERLLIRHDNSGLSPGWFLDWVEVNATKSGQVVRFNANRWLSKDQGDRRIVIEINAPST
uniref:PLAT domain-containing protein n=1 Tax=Plectus sambesii TaxID=2011161 RepID=A0A914VND4_9BILA